MPPADEQGLDAEAQNQVTCAHAGAGSLVERGPAYDDSTEFITLELAGAGLTVRVSAWMNVTRAGPYHALDVANGLRGPFIRVLPPETQPIDGLYMRFENRAGMGAAGESLGNGEGSAVMKPGAWQFAFGVQGDNVQADFAVLVCDG